MHRHITIYQAQKKLLFADIFSFTGSSHTYGAVLEHLYGSDPVGVGKGFHNLGELFHVNHYMQFRQYMVARLGCQGSFFSLSNFILDCAAQIVHILHESPE